jgi:hypothetical protein
MFGNSVPQFPPHVPKDGAGMDQVTQQLLRATAANSAAMKVNATVPPSRCSMLHKLLKLEPKSSLPLAAKRLSQH